MTQQPVVLLINHDKFMVSVKPATIAGKLQRLVDVTRAAYTIRKNNIVTWFTLDMCGYSNLAVDRKRASSEMSNKNNAMAMFSAILMNCFNSNFTRRCGLVSAGLLIAGLLWAMPAGAFVQGGRSPYLFGQAGHEISISQAVFPLQLDDGAEMVRAVSNAPDVSVFPIWVAGPVVAVAKRKVDNKIAQSAGNSMIAVIYPDIAEPYRSVFTQILDGIKEKAKGEVADYAVGAKPDITELNNSLRRKDARVVIALGRQGMKTAAALDGDIGVVVGGVLTVPDAEERNMQVNSLSPDPGLLFSRLQGMMQKCKRIFTVYNPQHNAWIMRLAKDAARAHGLELVAYEAQDLRAAMNAYKKIFAQANERRDAIWLPQDSTTVDEGSVLPLVLQESWNRNFVVFSSSFAHVRRGVLFSLYPDNVGLGRHLADSALSYLASGKKQSGMMPLREVLMAVNVRTARHLGIGMDKQQGVSMAFPQE